MSKNSLYTIWAVLFVICAGLGFVPEPAGLSRVALTWLSALFFLPPFLLLRSGDAAARRLIRTLSALSLGLTLVIMILSIVTAAGPLLLGNFLHALLAIVSTPMLCSGSWALSLFLWACLLMLCIRKPK